MLLTGVSTTLSAAHQRDGVLHGHTWLIKAWWEYDGSDARYKKQLLNDLLSDLDHNVLPDDLCDGEKIAAWIGERLFGCVVVEVNRSIEGFYARWENERLS